MSLSNHRYEGWVVVAPTERWTQLDNTAKKQLASVIQLTTAWQRHDRQQRENAALDKLKKSGMTLHEVDSEERDAFRKMLPEWMELLPDSLDVQQKRKLLGLAGAATVVGPLSGTANTRRNPAPATEAR